MTADVGELEPWWRVPWPVMCDARGKPLCPDGRAVRAMVVDWWERPYHEGPEETTVVEAAVDGVRVRAEIEWGYGYGADPWELAFCDQVLRQKGQALTVLWSVGRAPVPARFLEPHEPLTLDELLRRADAAPTWDESRWWLGQGVELCVRHDLRRSGFWLFAGPAAERLEVAPEEVVRELVRRRDSGEAVAPALRALVAGVGDAVFPVPLYRV